MNNKRLAYLLFRTVTGISIAVHGAVRLPKLEGFAEGMVAEFSDTFMPSVLILVAAYLIPIVEFAGGILTVIGKKATKYGLVGLMILMCMMMVGSCLTAKWDALLSQLLHAFIFFILLYLTPDDDKITTNKQPMI